MTDHPATALIEELDALGVVAAPRTPITAEPVTGRGWAYLGALLGGAVSIAANVAHSYVPPPGAPPGWAPERGAVIGAMFWPFALFVAIEILARTAWPAGRRWVALRFAGLLPVAVVAAVVSYRHLSGLLAFYGEDPLTATIGPLAVDGLMVMATGALLATGAGRLHLPAVAERGPARAAAPDPAGPIPPSAPVGPAAPASAPGLAGDLAAAPAARPAKAARPHVKRRPASAEKVAKVAARMPGATVAQVAARAGVSESTARRYLPAPSRPAGDAALTSATPLSPAATPVPAAA
jgi:hypothetical protein